MSKETRTIQLQEILDLANYAHEYGDDVILSSLYKFAQPVTNDDIKSYADNLVPEYDQEDADNATRTLTEWRGKFQIPTPIEHAYHLGWTAYANNAPDCPYEINQILLSESWTNGFNSAQSVDNR